MLLCALSIFVMDVRYHLHGFFHYDKMNTGQAGLNGTEVLGLAP